MSYRICIIGSGPTGIFTLKYLSQSPVPLSITLYEAEQHAGKGTPYLPGANDPVMLSNIPSIEIPELAETLFSWLHRQTDDYLGGYGIVRSRISEREFYPRVVLGDYFHDQFKAMVETAKNRGHEVKICAGHRVTDIALGYDHIRLSIAGTEQIDAIFDHVVMATGHNWPKETEVRPGYLSAPWPATALLAARHGRLGILGTSLSAIDALLTVATSCGSFVYDEAGVLQFQQAKGSEQFSAVMMSRKGLLPEADFYCPLPYLDPQACTRSAIAEAISNGPTGLLDRVFDLFREEIKIADPDYASEIGLDQLTVDTFADGYYARRSGTDPFIWAARNLAEAEHNYAQEHTVPWRYAILITHEIIAEAIPHLDAHDLTRFNRSFKSIFVDQYATVPHLSIKRMLALRNADRLEIIKLGQDYEIHTDGVVRGAKVTIADQYEIFNSFIDATGQSALSANHLPFPTLVQQGSVRPAATAEPAGFFADPLDAIYLRTGGIDVDECYRPRITGLLSNRLYCVAIPFLLHKHPFMQGITSAADLGEVAAKAIIADIATKAGDLLLTA